MLRDTSVQTKPEVALGELRKRICLADPDKPLPLHEGALAEEFGMSRTPIRQVLQRLAYERLVDIRSGVGTAAMPLDPKNRARDHLTHQAILQAIIAHPPAELSVGQHTDIIALGAIMNSADNVDADLHFEVRARLLAVLGELIADPILKDAFLAAHWRVIRWHMRDVAVDLESANSALDRIVGSVAADKAKDARDLFSKVLANPFAA